ncbi:MAG: hypothetical protein K8S87_07870 [Planctomycetes bacterium]|nr:hypothetical protein [Planctomycetota bacterium]
MALNPQQKKQAQTLIVLIGILGVVFYFMDPFRLFVKVSELPPEVKAKIEKAKIESAKMAKDMRNKTAISTVPIVSSKETKLNIHDSSENLFDLLPKTPSLNIILYMDKNKTPFKHNVFHHKITLGIQPKSVKLPEVAGTSSIKNKKMVKFENVINPKDGKKTNKFFEEGDEFIFNLILYRILRIDFNINELKIVDLSDGPTRGNEHDVPLR